MEKSHVTLEQAICPACGKTEDTGALLLDRQLRQRFNMHTTTGFAMCAEHKKMIEDGYVIMVGVNESKSNKEPNGNIRPAGAWRTGDIAAIKAQVFDQIFNAEIPKHRMSFCDPAVIEYLKGIAHPSDLPTPS